LASHHPLLGAARARRQYLTRVGGGHRLDALGPGAAYLLRSLVEQADAGLVVAVTANEVRRGMGLHRTVYVRARRELVAAGFLEPLGRRDDQRPCFRLLIPPRLACRRQPPRA
jgi:hypothetical protein